MCLKHQEKERQPVKRCKADVLTFLNSTWQLKQQQKITLKGFAANMIFTHTI